MSGRIRTAVRVDGVVQGVGFRPFVYALATRLGLAGWVGNDEDGVFAEVEGPAGAVEEFLSAVKSDAPPLARVERVSTRTVTVAGTAGFTIVASEAGGPRRALVSADSATCADCLRELDDPADRRFGYPFINCTNCGPRFTIVRDVPYDRPLTTMATFAMCAACAAEYHDPADRRFHAQPVCCPDCGPRLWLRSAGGADLVAGGGPEAGAGPGPRQAGDGEPVPAGRPPGAAPAAAVLTAAGRMLRAGQVLAVKGLGGYHLAALAADGAAVAALRGRKHREDKPFALMAADLATARALCETGPAAEAALTSAARPIVLLPRRRGGPVPVADAVAPGNRHLGVMLPYTALHRLLLRELPGPLVLTSGNVSDEPIAYRDEDALDRLGGIADAFLGHDRAIHIRTDDSVVRPVRGRVTMLRRSRGYVPRPLQVTGRFPRPVLACGAELKNTFCLGREDRAFLSHHIGDLENYETLRSFTEGIEHFQRLFGIVPRVVAHDLHPEYLSTKYALDLDGVSLAGVQHHHAHIASCLADNGEDGPVIGVAFDGTGYGTDGTIWGGEFLLASLATAERAGHLAGVPLPGGAAAIRHPGRLAAAYLDAAFPEGLPDGLPVAARHPDSWADVLALGRRGLNAPLTSSAGRLFDAVAALLGVRDSVNYEGQAAVELEQRAGAAGASAQAGNGTAAGDSTTGPSAQAGDGPQAGPTAQAGDGPAGAGGPGGRYRATIVAGGPSRPLTVAGAGLVRAAAEDLLAGQPVPVIAARFHDGVAAMIVEVCQRLREPSGLGTVALSGGVFQNVLLLESVTGRLEAAGFRVLTHSRVPPNDGGISLGQAVVAAARDRAGLLP